jgi:phosphosulfolactate synthase (CoM biosynthesis protein A)
MEDSYMNKAVKQIILKACPNLEREVSEELGRLEEYGYPAKIFLLGYIDRSEGSVPVSVTERARMAVRSLEDGFMALVRVERPEMDIDAIMVEEEMKQRASKKAAKGL